MGELHSRVLAALDEVTNKNQSQQSPEDNEGFFAVFVRALKSDMSHGSEFDRNAEEGTLVSYLKKSCEFISKIIRVSRHLTLRLSLLWVNVYSATTRTGVLGRRLSIHNGFRKQKILKFFGKQTNYFYEFEVCFLRGQVSSNLRKAQGWGKSV